MKLASEHLWLLIIRYISYPSGGKAAHAVGAILFFFSLLDRTSVIDGDGMMKGGSLHSNDHPANLKRPMNKKDNVTLRGAFRRDVPGHYVAL